MAGKPICVTTGTTTELNLADRMRELNAAYMPLKFQNDGQTYAAYLQGRCVAVTSDRALLAAKRSSFPDPKAHVLLARPEQRAPGDGHGEWRSGLGRRSALDHLRLDAGRGVRHHPSQRRGQTR